MRNNSSLETSLRTSVQIKRVNNSNLMFWGTCMRIRFAIAFLVPFQSRFQSHCSLDQKSGNEQLWKDPIWRPKNSGLPFPSAHEDQRFFFLTASRLAFAASRLSYVGKNQEEPLKPGYSTTARYVQKWKLKAYRYYLTPVCFTQYPFSLDDNQCFMFHLLNHNRQTNLLEPYLQYIGTFTRPLVLSLEINFLWLSYWK